MKKKWTKKERSEQARQAGKLGGASVARENRSFTKDPEAAKAAGRLGGLASAAARRAKREQQ